MLFLFDTKSLEQFRDKHRNERCLIIATGPSLNKTNLSLFQGEVLFGVNSCYNLDLSFSYYCVLDGKVWDNRGQQIIDLVERQGIPLFLTHNCVSDYRSPNLHVVRRRGYMQESGFGDITRGIYRGDTVTIMCLQIAYFMGFSEVYLFGCDCTYRGKHHFDGTPVDNVLRMDWSPVFGYYQMCKELFEADGRKIYNATEGGELEVFERKTPVQTKTHPGHRA